MMEFFNSLAVFGFHSQLRELHLVSNFMKCVELKNIVIILSCGKGVELKGFGVVIIPKLLS